MRLSGGDLRRLGKSLETPDCSGTRYEPLREIGRGGMGVVWEAIDTQLNRSVALKILPAWEDAEPAAGQLLSEARLLAGLEHPGIVPVHDSGLLADGRSYYAMKLVRGTTLDQFTAGLPSRNARLRTFVRLCEAVAFAHARGIVHRDLKPSNVMVGEFGEVLVLDWGMAARVDSDAAAPAGGTPGYRAPEGGCSIASDVYSLGRVLERLLTPISDQPPALRAIAGCAAHSDPSRRYASAAGLAEDVNRFLDQQAVSVYEESLLAMARRLLVRHRTPVAVVATYIVARALIFYFSRR